MTSAERHEVPAQVACAAGMESIINLVVRRKYGEGKTIQAFVDGPRTVLECNAKRADEHIDLADLRRATQVVARTLAQLLA